jgi:hypothetical protein
MLRWGLRTGVEIEGSIGHLRFTWERLSGVGRVEERPFVHPREVR